jgi:hypothetical protein
VRGRNTGGSGAWSFPRYFSTGGSPQAWHEGVEDENPISTKGAEEKPTAFGLSQNFPNGFNPTTQIKYSLPVDAHVRLSVYDVLGQEVATLVNSDEAAGFKAVTFNAGNLPSGIYFYRLTAGDFSDIKKMILLK